jgi:hypothetical protein
MEILYGLVVQFVATFAAVHFIALIWSRSGRPTG